MRTADGTLRAARTHAEVLVRKVHQRCVRVYNAERAADDWTKIKWLLALSCDNIAHLLMAHDMERGGRGVSGVHSAHTSLWADKHDGLLLLNFKVD